MTKSEHTKNWYLKNKDKILKEKKEYYLQNREKIKKQRKLARKKYPDLYKNQDLKKNYGITLDTYNDLLKSQNYKCAICKTEQSDLLKKLAVDHNHKSGIIRGLLCDSCNRGIGLLGDDIQILNRAINYLKGK